MNFLALLERFSGSLLKVKDEVGRTDEVSRSLTAAYDEGHFPVLFERQS